MNWEAIHDNWDRVRSSLQAEWGDLAGADIDNIAGDRDNLEAWLRQRYGWSHREAERRVEEFVDRCYLG